MKFSRCILFQLLHGGGTGPRGVAEVVGGYQWVCLSVCFVTASEVSMGCSLLILPIRCGANIPAPLVIFNNIDRACFAIALFAHLGFPARMAPTCVHLTRRLMALLKGPSSCSSPLLHKPHLSPSGSVVPKVLPPRAACTRSHDAREAQW